MKGYFYTLLVTSVCGAVFAVLAWGGFEKYIRYIASLICVTLIILPFRDIDVSEIKQVAEDGIRSEISQNSSELHLLASDMAENRAEDYISQIVFQRFGINTVSTDIKIDWEKEEPVIESICVTLRQEDMNKAETAKEYLIGVLGGEVTVVESRDDT
ncbi:MAG: hypothetical protein IJC20_03920 [Clostridia bacterium]|nr:hypothetical protein [Clostridia bacterium]